MYHGEGNGATIPSPFEGGVNAQGGDLSPVYFDLHISTAYLESVVSVGFIVLVSTAIHRHRTTRVKFAARLPHLLSPPFPFNFIFIFTCTLASNCNLFGHSTLEDHTLRNMPQLRTKKNTHTDSSMVFPGGIVSTHRQSMLPHRPERWLASVSRPYLSSRRSGLINTNPSFFFPNFPFGELGT